VPLPGDLRPARVIRLGQGGQESFTALARTDRTVPGHGACSGHPGRTLTSGSRFRRTDRTWPI